MEHKKPEAERDKRLKYLKKLNGVNADREEKVEGT